MIAAILRAQFLIMRRTLGRSATLSVVGGLFWYGLWTLGAVGVFSVTSSAPAGRLSTMLSLVLAGVCAWWQVMPIISASMGSSLDLRKLLAYPLPHERLFVVEILLRLAGGAEMVLVLSGAAAGLIVNPAARGIFAMPAAFAGFVGFNLLLASGVRSLLERLLTRRKVREAMLLLMAALWVMPRFFMMTGYHSRWENQALSAVRNMAFPWSATAHAALGESRAISWLALAAWIAAAAWFGRAQFERSLRYDTAAAFATPRESAAPAGGGWFGLPSRVLPDPLAVMVEKELRTLSRAPTFRHMFFMGFTFGLLVWLPMVVGRSASSDSFMASHFLTVVSLYSLTLLGQVTYWNSFAFDRSAAAFWFVAPQPFSKVLIAKNLASQVPVFLEIAVLTVISSAFRLLQGWGQVAEAVVVVATCSLYMLAMGNVTSVEYPRALNPERVSQGGGSSGRFQALVLIFYPLALLPVALAFLARYAFNSEIVFRAAMAVAFAAGVVVYKLTLDSANSTAAKRRETFLRILGTGEGPVVS